MPKLRFSGLFADFLVSIYDIIKSKKYIMSTVYEDTAA